MRRFTMPTTVLAIAGLVRAQSNIDAVNKFAWSENVGWTNWRDAGSPSGAQGVNVQGTFLSGLVWSENVGWINLGDGDPGLAGGAETQYANLNGSDFGVNRDVDTGELFGMGWAENVGWLDFDGGALATPPQPARVEAGRLRGYAWGENIGWINLDDAVHYVSLAAGGATIVSADPPLDNPFVGGTQPFRDVLQTGPGAAITQGIGGAGTPPQGPYTYSPITLTFSQPPAPPLALGNVMISCTGGSCPTVTGVGGAGVGPYSIALSGPIPPGHCTTLTFAGVPGQKVQYQSLPADTNMSGSVSSSDVLTLVNAINNGQANQAANLPRFNINRASVVSATDVLRLVQLLNGTNASQAWLGTAVASCP